MLLFCFYSIATSISIQASENYNPRCTGKISLLRAIECVLEHSPEYKYEKLELGVREGRKVVSSYLFPSNPVFSFSQSLRSGGEKNFLETNRSNYFLNGEIAISQEIFISSIRQTKMASSNLQISAQQLKIEITKRETIAETIKVSIRYETSKKILSELENLYKKSLLLHNIIQERVKKGLSAPIDLTLSYAEVLKTKKLYELAKRQKSSHQANLTVMMGVPFTSLEEVSSIPENVQVQEKSLEKLIEYGLKNRLEILLAEQNIRFQRKTTEILQQEKIPNLTFSAFTQRDGFNENVVGFRFGLPLRVWRTNKGEILESQFKEKQAEELKEIQSHSIRQEIIQAIQNFESLNSEIQGYTKESLENIDQAISNLQKAMQNGQIPLREGLLTQQSFINTKLAYLETLGEYMVSAIEVLRAAGFSLLEFEHVQ